jgi:hypothetical protein
MPLSAYAKDNFIAPGMSTFTSACVKDMAGTSVEQEHWLNNYMLNTLFRIKLDDEVRQSLFNFLRRSQFAFREYALAREQTTRYLGSDAVSTYFVAIGHWEVFLAYAYQAYELLAGTDKRALFEPGDGSVLQHLCLLYNRSKHVNKAISGGQVAAGSILAVWLTNEGLRAVDADLTFDEMAAILEDLARWSDAAQDPLTMREKLLIHYPEAAGTDDVVGRDYGSR